MTLELSLAAANAVVNAVTKKLDGGCLRVYGGARPDTANDPEVSAPLIELRFSDPAFAPSSNARATAYAIKSMAAQADGAATWFRAYSREGSCVFDGGIGAGQLDMGTSELGQGGTVRVSSFSYGIDQ